MPRPPLSAMFSPRVSVPFTYKYRDEERDEETIQDLPLKHIHFQLAGHIGCTDQPNTVHAFWTRQQKRQTTNLPNYRFHQKIDLHMCRHITWIIGNYWEACFSLTGIVKSMNEFVTHHKPNGAKLEVAARKKLSDAGEGEGEGEGGGRVRGRESLLWPVWFEEWKVENPFQNICTPKS